MFRHALPLLLFFSMALSAESIRVRENEDREIEYRNIEILSGDITGLNVSYKAKITYNQLGDEIKSEYEGGATKIRFARMVKEDREKYGSRYGYDPEKAKAVIKAREKARAALAAKRRELGKLEVLRGVRLEILRVDDRGAYCAAKPNLEFPKEPASLDDGHYSGPAHYTKVIEAYRDKLRAAQRREEEFYKTNPALRRPIYVLGLGAIAGNAGGEIWSGDLYACGVTREKKLGDPSDTAQPANDAGDWTKQFATTPDAALQALKNSTLIHD